SSSTRGRRARGAMGRGARQIGIGLLVLTSAVAGASLPSASATEIEISGAIVGLPGVSPRIAVQSFQARRFSAVIPQRFDYSCGSAALASLLTYSYHMPVDELTVFRSMIEHGNKALIEREGFSLLDMKQYLARRGLPSGGFRAPLSKLESAGVPAIALVNERGYRHFVIVTGIEDGQILLADPAVGLRSERIGVFEHQWSGIFFLILNHVKEARANFNAPHNWAVAPVAPLGLARFMVDFSTLRQISAGNPTIF
ncbi:MAG: C39 family peptidase, partial [Acetobacteraceae bacterium]